MATFDKTGQGGTTGHPANGRTPYLVENTIDMSTSGFQPAADDIVQALDIPAESIVLNAGLEVLTASPSGVTLDLGDAGDVDKYVDGHDSTSTGYAANVVNASNVGHVYGSADTIDIKVLGAQDTSGKVRVWAVVCDISGIDETDHN
mgnify:CR=1 FL=1|tara:strand:- start:49 stop:489 length:441 start_codon:yes stop_codon:yes gene_type:complete